MKRISIYVSAFIGVFMLLNVVYAEDSINTENDPLITQSYLEMRIEQIKTYFEGTQKLLKEDVAAIDQRISTLEQQSTKNSQFEVVTIKAGKKMICGSGTEIILRAGNAKAIASIQGGIVDTTGGIDIQNDKEIPKQHLLIIPREDGRGIIASTKTDVIVMIRGTYTIK